MNQVPATATSGAGSPVAVSLTVSPVKNAEGKIVGASKIARDITGRRRAQAREKVLVAELDHRVKNTLARVAMVATSLAQVISGQFPRWLGWPGLVVGVFGLASSAFLSAIGQSIVGGSSPLGSWVLGFWIWMVATGVVLFRRTPHRRLEG